MCFKEGWRPVWRRGSGKQEETLHYTAPESRGASVGVALCNRVQRLSGARLYPRLMQLNYTVTAAAALWVPVLCVAGLVLGVTSLTGWTVLAGFTLLPSLLLARLSKAAPSVSERIHERH